jgi:hypothetical protein
MAAMVSEREHDPVARGNPGHIAADSLDNAGRLVAKYDRERVEDLAVGPSEVRVADTCR